MDNFLAWTTLGVTGVAFVSLVTIAYQKQQWLPFLASVAGAFGFSAQGLWIATLLTPATSANERVFGAFVFLNGVLAVGAAVFLAFMWENRVKKDPVFAVAVVALAAAMAGLWYAVGLFMHQHFWFWLQAAFVLGGAWMTLVLMYYTGRAMLRRNR